MLFSIPPIEKEKAVQYLLDNIPAETLNDVATLMTEKGRDWWLDYHFSGGMGVRNLLLEGGFQWDFIELDDVWVELIEKAVRKNSVNNVEILISGDIKGFRIIHLMS
jgi:hypothetical protein